MPDDIYVLPILNKYLLYSPLRSFAAFINNAALVILHKFFSKSDRYDIPKNIMDIIDILNEPLEVPPKKQEQIHPAFLGLITTRGCNISCNYCNFGSSKYLKDVLKPDYAIASVQWMAEYVKKFDHDILEIHFFGGEPFVAGNIIDITIHYARMLANKLNIYNTTL